MEGASAGSRAVLQKLIDAMAIAKVKPVLDKRRFALDDLKAALEYLATGQHIGKVIVDIA
jgi:NADPH:quinone reductase-like Zn-dependent oxidoreductase